MEEPELKLPIALMLVAVLGGAAWYYLSREEAPESAVVEDAVSREEESPAGSLPQDDSGPRYPMPESPASRLPQGELTELPALDDSDSYFLLEIGNAFGPSIEALLVREGVIDRLVATIDNLPRSALPEQIRPVGQLKEPFRPDDGEADTIILKHNSYTRYESLVAQIYYADLDAVYDTYQRFYPLFQKAYERLGYPNSYFNDRLIEVIDHLVATPMPEGPIVLTRPNVLYEFADPDLEALSSGQKLMLRMGPDNAATIKRRLLKFRERLVQP